MKKVKISLVALALLAGVTAFATGSKANAQSSCTTTSGSIDDECPFGDNTCCISAGTVTQTQGVNVVTINPGQPVLRD